MTFTAPTAEQLGIFLALQEIDGRRADLLIDQAVALCQTVVKPLPDQASAVVLSAAARAYTNPQAVTYETIGPMSVQRPQGSGGLYLTRADKAALKAAAGRGGAFTVDPTPGGATPWPTWPPDGSLGPGGLAYEPGWGWV
ncbi:hypothetical protein [Kitasatospora sp. NPDC058478]|uniref:hypothetical protein n=1 Tax=unclassified Kitasatospora TaxID=2633591 RepID=UPI0036507E59